MVHILLDNNVYIDMWLDTRLFLDLYLKIIEGHFLMIDYEKFIFNFFPFVLIYCLKWPHWLGPWIVSIFEVFNHVIH
jgi:hypothetical protein